MMMRRAALPAALWLAAFPVAAQTLASLPPGTVLSPLRA
jgi:hypothetical protein